MVRHHFLNVFLIFLAFLWPSKGICQDKSGSDFHFWSDISLIHHFSAKWSYTGDMGARGLLSDRDWNMLYLRPTIRWRLTSSFDLRGGLSVFQTWNKDITNQTELRMHQEANLKWPNLAGFVFKHMVRFEERFFFNENIENEFSARFRYRPSMETPDFKIFGIQRPFYGLISLDMFFPMGNIAAEIYVNNYRILCGLGNRISDKLRIELHYFWQRSRLLTGDGFKTAENVLRIRFFVMLNEPK